MVPDLKSGVCKSTVGSNPTPSAKVWEHSIMVLWLSPKQQIEVRFLLLLPKICMYSIMVIMSDFQSEDVSSILTTCSIK